MLSKAYQGYPMGFRSPLNDRMKTETTVDLELAKLWRDMQDGRISHESWEFRSQVIDCTKRLFGDFLEWLDAQDQNTKISQNGYDFIVDTIQFINTGRRTVSIATRTGIITTEIRTDKYENLSAAGRTTKLRELLKVHPREVIFEWVKHKDGFSDMLCTINFLFGTDMRS